MRDRAAIVLIIAIGALQGVIYLCSNAAVPTYSTDMVVISGFLQNFTHSLFHGVLYPRWMGNQFAGAGAPVFVIYSPLAFYLGSIFPLSTASDPYGIYQLGLAMCAGIIGSTLAAYFWLRRHAPVGTAALIACVLLLIPTRFLAMQVQTGFAAIWATVWFPLGLYCVERWREGDGRRYLAGFTATLALIVLTHLPSSLLFWPLLMLYGLCYRRPDKRTVGGLGVACALGLLLTSVYLIPAWANRPDISLDRYLKFFTDYNILFQPLDSMLFYFIPRILLDALPFMMLAAVALWLARKHSGPETLRPVAWLCGLAVLLTCPLFTPASEALWQHSSLLHWLQAPFRLLSLYFVLSPVLLLGISRHVSRPAFTAILFLFLVPDGWHCWNDYAVRRQISASANAQHIQQMNLLTQAAATEYKTAWMPPGDIQPGYFKMVYADIPFAAIVHGSGSITVTSWQDEHITFKAVTAAAATIRIRQHFFPAWHAESGGVPLPVRPDPLGLVLIDVPAGNHPITLRFTALKGSEWGLALSLASLLAVCAMCRKPRQAL